jgi:2'-5' RNA ligase
MTPASTHPASHGEVHRLFFALWPEESVRAQLDAAAASVDAFRDTGRRVPVEKLHLTLHFLGGWPSLPDAGIAAASAAAANVACRALHLVIDRAGSFKAARVGWLAPGGNSGLDALWSGLGHALGDAGIATRAHDRFSPHVTVLRNLRAQFDDVEVEPVSWPVEDFVLVHSHGGCYEQVGRWSLAPAD